MTISLSSLQHTALTILKHASLLPEIIARASFVAVICATLLGAAAATLVLLQTSITPPGDAVYQKPLRFSEETYRDVVGLRSSFEAQRATVRTTQIPNVFSPQPGH